MPKPTLEITLRAVAQLTSLSTIMLALLIEFTFALHIYTLKAARATRTRNIAPLALAASQ